MTNSHKFLTQYTKPTLGAMVAEVVQGNILMWVMCSFYSNSLNYIKLKVVDIGCGDWQFSKNLNLEGIDYKGYDVASFVVNRNLAKYKKPNIDFIHYNGDFSTLPTADLAICKDVLQHLPNHNIQRFIKNLPKYKYALIANDIDRAGENDDILLDIYAYRSLDLRREPFNLSLEVVFEIVREPKEPNIAVMLWQNPNL